MSALRNRVFVTALEETLKAQLLECVRENDLGMAAIGRALAYRTTSVVVVYAIVRCFDEAVFWQGAEYLAVDWATFTPGERALVLEELRDRLLSAMRESVTQ